MTELNDSEGLLDLNDMDPIQVDRELDNLRGLPSSTFTELVYRGKVEAIESVIHLLVKKSGLEADVKGLKAPRPEGLLSKPVQMRLYQQGWLSTVERLVEKSD